MNQREHGPAGEIASAYSKPFLTEDGTECRRCSQPLTQHLAAICGGDDGTVVAAGKSGYTKSAVTPVPTEGAAELLPLECLQCDRANGPLYPVDADCVGWICKECMARLTTPTEKSEER